VDRSSVGRRRAGLVIDLDDVIYGIHALDEALNAGEKLRTIHIGAQRRRDPAVRHFIDEAKARGIPLRFEDGAFFAHFPYKAHQSVVAFGEPFSYVSLDDILATPRTGPLLVVLLDHITDPHNAGAIIRTAEAAGAHGLILPERRAVGVNATVRKAAAGAAAHLPVARVANIAQSVRILKKAGVWVAGADASESAVPYDGVDLRGDCAVVIGAEGHGLSQLVARECDFLLRIPMLGMVGSLNASVAAGVLLYEVVRQRAGSEKSP